MNSDLETSGGEQNVDVAHLEGEIIKRLDRTAGALGFAALYTEFSGIYGLPMTKAANLTRAALGELNELRLVEVNEVSRTVSLVPNELATASPGSELSEPEHHGTPSGSHML